MGNQTPSFQTYPLCNELVRPEPTVLSGHLRSERLLSFALVGCILFYTYISETSDDKERLILLHN